LCECGVCLLISDAFCETAVLMSMKTYFFSLESIAANKPFQVNKGEPSTKEAL
jgi:hypothetical protein